MNKKGFELAVNMLVVIILSLVLFGAGMFLFTKIIKEGTSIEASITERMQEQLNSAMNDGSIIVIPQQRITATPGNKAAFPLGFWNEFEEADFELEVTSAPGWDSSDWSIAYISGYNAVKQNDRIHALIAINIPKVASKGQYAFDIKINHKLVTPPSVWNDYGTLQRIYVVVP